VVISQTMLAGCLLAISLGGASAYAPSFSTMPALRASSSMSTRELARVARMQVEEEVYDEFPSMAELAAAEGMTEDEYVAKMGFDEAMTEEEYLKEQEDELSQEAQVVVNNMKSESGVEFAPWMKVDAEKIAKAKKEREERKARAAANRGQSDPMQIDPQAAELGGGGGLKSKVLSEEEVELRWSTQDEAGNAGFIVQRRKGGSSDFVALESFENFSPLRTKGPAGGDYVYLDDTAGPGTWVYRILDCTTTGTRSAVCQKLVEIDSNAEQTQTLFVGGFILLLAVAGGIAGTLADPMQTTAL